MNNRIWTPIPEDICWWNVSSLKPRNKDLIVMFPKELENESILKNNIPKMLKVIREYIGEVKLYRSCLYKVETFHFDSQKYSMIAEANKHQEIATKLSAIMNEGISPYFWDFRDGFEGYINTNYVNCDYFIYLDKK